MEGDHPYHESYHLKQSERVPVAGVWEHQSVVALSHVECIVITANDFGVMITRKTHQAVCDFYKSYPSDKSLLKSLDQYGRWDKYKRTLVEELNQYYADPMNFGLPIHMPDYKDDTNGDRYLHMYVDRKGPEKIRHPKPRHFSIESMHPPKLGLDNFSNK